jgi:hypothetical protein
VGIGRWCVLSRRWCRSEGVAARYDGVLFVLYVAHVSGDSVGAGVVDGALVVVSPPYRQAAAVLGISVAVLDAPVLVQPSVRYIAPLGRDITGVWEIVYVGAGAQYPDVDLHPSADVCCGDACVWAWASEYPVSRAAVQYRGSVEGVVAEVGGFGLVPSA